MSAHSLPWFLCEVPQHAERDDSHPIATEPGCLSKLRRAEHIGGTDIFINEAWVHRAQMQSAPASHFVDLQQRECLCGTVSRKGQITQFQAALHYLPECSIQHNRASICRRKSTCDDDHGKQNLPCQRDTVTSEKIEDTRRNKTASGGANVSETLAPGRGAHRSPMFQRAVLTGSRSALASPLAPAQAVLSFLHENQVQPSQASESGVI